MAIAFESANGNSAGASTTLSVSATIGSNTNGCMIIFLAQGTNANDTLTDLTVNGTSIFSTNQITKFASTKAADYFSYVYYVLTPATGTYNLTLTSTGNANDWRMVYANYTGVKQVTPPDASNRQGSASAVTTVDTNVTPVAANCWALSCLNTGSGSATASTGTTLRAHGTANITFIGDSNAAVSAGSAYHLIWTTGNAEWDSFDLTLAPSAPPFTAPANPFPMQAIKRASTY